MVSILKRIHKFLILILISSLIIVIADVANDTDSTIINSTTIRASDINSKFTMLLAELQTNSDLNPQVETDGFYQFKGESTISEGETADTVSASTILTELYKIGTELYPNQNELDNLIGNKDINCQEIEVDRNYICSDELNALFSQVKADISNYTSTVTSGASSSSPIAIGGNTTFLIDESNTLKAIGNNTYGSAGIGTAMFPDFQPITDINQLNYDNQYVTSLTTVNTDNLAQDEYFTQIATYNTVCGVTNLKNLFCWGLNTSGELGIGNTTSVRKTIPQKVTFFNANVKKVAIADKVVCAQTIDGTTYCWGSNQYGLTGLGVSSGIQSTPVAIETTDGLGVSLFSSPFKDIFLMPGTRTACGLDQLDRIYCWGYTGKGILGDSGTIDTSNTAFHTKATPVASNYQFSKIGIGYDYICGLKKDSQALYCWGYGHVGQLGQFTLNNSSTPGIVSVGNVVDFGTGLFHTCSTNTQDQIWCWGDTRRGQFGNGVEYPAGQQNPFPSLMPYFYEKLIIASQNACGIDSTGDIYCWGSSGKSISTSANDPQSTPIIFYSYP